jgi:glycosyltransferase involved in cell wall biosynthesis
MTQNPAPPGRTVVVPVYGNEDTLAALCAELGEIARAVGGDLEAVFVVDGSPDGSLELLRARLPREPFPSQLVALSRNFGAFAAIRAGLEAARGGRIAVMAADLQDPPELIVRFFEALERGDCDVVVGRRTARRDPLPSRIASSLFWFLYRRWVQPETPRGGVDVFACNDKVRRSLLALRESHSSLVAQLLWLGYRRGELPYARRPRGGATPSAWSWRRRWRYMTDNVFAFTQLPITALRRLGALGLVVSLGASLVVLGAWATGAIRVSGYTPIMLFVGVSTSFQLLALGVVGEYVWRAYENTKGRPDSLIAEHLRFAGEAVDG